MTKLKRMKIDKPWEVFECRLGDYDDKNREFKTEREAKEQLEKWCAEDNEYYGFVAKKVLEVRNPPLSNSEAKANQP